MFFRLYFHVCAFYFLLRRDRTKQRKEGLVTYTYSGKQTCVSCGNWSQELIVHVKILWMCARSLLRNVALFFW